MEVTCSSAVNVHFDNNCISPMMCTLKASDNVRMSLGDFYCYDMKLSISGNCRVTADEVNIPTGLFNVSDSAILKFNIMHGKNHTFNATNQAEISAYSYVFSPIEQAKINVINGSYFKGLGYIVDSAELNVRDNSFGSIWAKEALSINVSNNSTVEYAGPLVESKVEINKDETSNATRK